MNVCVYVYGFYTGAYVFLFMQVCICMYEYMLLRMHVCTYVCTIALEANIDLCFMKTEL